MDIIRVLLLEDQEGEARLNQKLLERSPTMEFRFTACQTLKAAIDALQCDRFDVALLDLHVPDSTGIDTYLAIQEAAPELPAVIISGTGDEYFAQNLIRHGAQDFLVKGAINSDTLSRVVRFAMARKPASLNEGSLAQPYDSSSLHQSGSFLLDGDACITMASASVPMLLGTSDVLSILQKPLEIFLRAEERPKFDDTVSKVWSAQRTVLCALQREGAGPSDPRLSLVLSPVMRNGTVHAVAGLLFPSPTGFEKVLDDIRFAQGLGTLIEESGDGVFRLSESCFTHVNAALAAMLGYDVDELTGVALTDVVSPEDTATVKQTLESCHLRTPPLQTLAVRLLHRAGARIPVRLKIGMVQHHGVSQVFGSVNDVSAEYQLIDQKRFQADLATQLAHVSGSDGVAQVLLNTLPRLENIAYAALYMRNPLTNTMERLSWAGVEGPFPTEAEDPRFAKQLESWISDLSPCYFGVAELAEQGLDTLLSPPGVRSLAFIPVHNEHTVHAVIVAGSGTADRIPYSTQRLLEITAVITGSVLNRITAEEAERRTKEEDLKRGELIFRAAGFAASRFMAAENWEDCLPDVLERFGTASNVCRVALFETATDSDGKRTLRLRSVWVRPELRDGVIDHLPDGQTLEEPPFLRWAEELGARHPISSVIDGLPDAERNFFTSQNVRSAALIPVFSGKSWWGVVRFDECRIRRIWLECEINAMTASVETLGAAIHRQKGEEEIRRAHEEAMRAEQIKNAFIANISHELRTPVNIIIGFLSLVSETCRPEDSEESSDYSQEIADASARLIRTVDSLMEISRFQARDIHPTFLPLRLDKLLVNCVSKYRRQIQEKGLELQVENNCGEAEILGDEHFLSQAFENLLDNAVKFTPRGSVRLSLDRGEEGRLHVQISDTGIGISKQFLQQIFEPYFQEDFGYSRTYEGVGLGLTLVKLFLEAHGAAIGIQSERDAGTTIDVFFPAPTR
ncbi:MAG: response regulator [Bacteroidetes bacterium]|nr:response regulator [Bacteroidota bacterium]